MKQNEFTQTTPPTATTHKTQDTSNREHHCENRAQSPSIGRSIQKL